MNFLYDLQLNEWMEMLLELFGATALYPMTVHEKLNNMFGVYWIGRGGSQIWPPRSPDLKISTFFSLNICEILCFSVRTSIYRCIKSRDHSCYPIRLKLTEEYQDQVRHSLQLNGTHFEHLQ